MTGPLSDLTVLDLTRVLAGPYATMVLADLGARVIKVEHPDGGDDARSFPPFHGDRSAYFETLNRGKESVALDLADEQDRDRFEELLSEADVLVENFRPGTMGRLGYDYATVAATHPELIYASVSGFGQTGPYAERPAYDMVVQAMGGLMSLTGHEGQPPVRVGTSIGDITAGLFAVSGILAALHDRTRTGRGQHVDVAMLDSQVAILENAVARHAATGESPGPLGSRHPSIAPFAAYRAADGHLVVDSTTNFRDDAIDDLHQMLIITEFDIRLFHLALTFHVDVVWSVDQDVADFGIFQQQLQRSQAERFVENFVNETLALVSVEERILGITQVLDNDADLFA